MTIFVRTFILVIRNTIAVSILWKQEPAPSETAIDRVFGIDTRFFENNSIFTLAFLILPRSDIGYHIVATQVIRGSQVNIQSNRSVENDSTSQLLHFKVFVDIVVKDSVELFSLNIHEIFSKNGEKINEVVLSSCTDKWNSQIDTSIAAGIAVAAVHVNQERESVSTVQLGEVGSSGKTEFHGRRARTKGMTLARFLVDIFQFTNPQALLVLVRRRESGAEEHGHVHGLVFGQGESGLQIGLQITNSTRFTSIVIRNFPGRRVLDRQAKVVVKDREGHTHIEIVPDTQGKTNIGTQAHELGNFAPARIGSPRPVQVIVAIGIVHKGEERQLGVSKGLTGLGLVYTDKAFLVQCLWMGRIGANSQRQGQSRNYSFHRVSLMRVFPNTFAKI